jgi:hypothetical protein
MNALWIYLIAQLTYLSTTLADTPKKCCDNDTNLIVENKCAPDVSGKSLPVALKCSEKFVLDPFTFPDEDSYNVTADGSLNATDFQQLVPPGE